MSFPPSVFLLEPLHLFLLCSLPVNGANSSRDKEKGRKKKRDIYMSRENLSPCRPLHATGQKRKEEGGGEGKASSAVLLLFQPFFIFRYHGPPLLPFLPHCLFETRERRALAPTRGRKGGGGGGKALPNCFRLPSTHPCPFLLIMKHLQRLTYVARK